MSKTKIYVEQKQNTLHFTRPNLKYKNKTWNFPPEKKIKLANSKYAWSCFTI